MAPRARRRAATAPPPLLLLLLLPSLCTALVWQNWAFNQQFNVTGIVNATTEADVAAVLLAHARVKPFGAAHSFSGIDGTSGVMLRLVPPADPVARLGPGTVRAHAGLHLYELNALLESRWGLALANLGAIAMQTVAGATQTNTHGTGATTGTAGFITGFTAVLPNGTAVYANSSTHAELFRAGRAGAGALGVLTWVELAVVPLWRLEKITVPGYALPDLLAAVPALRRQWPRVEWWYTPYANASGTVVVRADVPASAPVTGCWGAPSYPTPLTPPPDGLAAWPAGTSACTDVSYKALTGATGDDFTRYTEMEMMVGEADFGALAADFAAFQDSVAPQCASAACRRSLHTGGRFVSADDIWLSPFYGRDTAVFSMVVYGSVTDEADPAVVQLYDAGLQSAALRYGARPHLGKNNYYRDRVYSLA